MGSNGRVSAMGERERDSLDGARRESDRGSSSSGDEYAPSLGMSARWARRGRPRERRSWWSVARAWLLVAGAAAALGTTNAGVEMLDPSDWGVWPASQLNQNNLTVSVHGSAFFSTNVSACRVGDFVVPLTHVNSTLVRCTVSPSLRLQKGFAYIEVSMNGLDFTSDRITFALHEPVKLEQVFPYGWDKGGGGVLRISGSNFAAGSSKCAFGAGNTGNVPAVSGSTPSEVVSSAFMKCETPAFSSVGMTDASIRTWGESGSLSGSRAFEVWEEPCSIEVSATWNSTRVNHTSVAVVLQGRGNDELVEPLNMFGYSCHFGTITVSAVMDTLTVNRTVTCISPVSQYSNASVELWTGPNIDSFKPCTTFPTFLYPADSDDSFDEVPGDETAVIYTGSNVTVVPTFVLASGGSIVSVVGSGLSSATSCRVDTDTTAPVQFVSSAYVQCELSEHDEGEAILFPSTSSNVQSTNIYFLSLSEVSSLYPEFGTLEGGTSVRVRGAHFTDTVDLACRFGSVSVLASYYSTTQIDCVSPSHTSGSVSVGVGRRDVMSNSFIGVNNTYVYNSSDVLGAVMPSVVENVGSTSLSLVWSQIYTAGTGCRVNGLPLDPCIVSGSTSPGFVEVYSTSFARNERVSEPAYFAYYRSPVVSGSIPSVVQNFIPTVVYMLGSDFVDEALVLCLFDDTALDATFVSSALVKCTSHLVGATGNVDAQVGFGSANDEGVWSRTVMSLSAVDILNMTSISPSRGVLAGGTVITVLGEGFEGVGVVYCRVGTVSYIQARIIHDGRVECSSPSYFDETVDIQVHILGNVYANTAQLFVYSSGVEVVAVIAPVSPLVGNNDISIFGLSGSVGDRYDCVMSGAATRGNFTRFGELECVNPAGDEGFAAVGIGSILDDTSDQQTMEYVRSPIIRSIYPFNGPTTGGTLIHIAGEHLRDSAFLSLEGAGASSQFHSSALIVSELPESTANVFTARVRMNGNLTSNALTFTSRAAITLSSVSPLGIAESGGSILQVVGSNMPNDLGLYCSFGSIYVSAQWVSTAAATCVSPAHLADVSTTFRMLADRFASEVHVDVSYVQASYVDYILPPSLAASELPYAVSVFGSWLSSASCDGSVLPLNTSWAASFLCTIDPVGVGYTSVSVISRGLTVSISYLIKETPLLLSVAPPGASTLPDEIFTLSVQHLIDEDDQFFCLFDSLSSAGSQVVSSALVRCTSPETTKVSTRITIKGGDGALAVPRQSVPTISSISPSTSGDIGGTVVTISGSDMPLVDNAAVCSFGSIGPISTQYASASTVRCASPAGVSGTSMLVCVSVYSTLSASKSCAPAGIVVVAPVDPPIILDNGVSSKLGGYFYLWRSAASYAQVSVLSSVAFGAANATMSTDIVSVYISPGLAGGFTPVSTTNDVGGLSFDQVLVQPTTTVRGVQPKITPMAGGGHVWITGVDLKSEELRLSFDDDATTCFLVVSSALVVAEVPSHELGGSIIKAGLGSREDSNGIGIGPFTSTSLDYITGIDLTSISAIIGPDVGTKSVTLTGAGFSDTAMLGCKFGTVGPTTGAYVHQGEIRCAVPGHVVGEVPVEVSANGRDFTFNSSLPSNGGSSTYFYWSAAPSGTPPTYRGVTYTYVHSPSAVDSLSPAAAPMYIPTRFTVYGKGMDSQMNDLCNSNVTGAIRVSATDVSLTCEWAASSVAGFVQVGYRAIMTYAHYNPSQTQFEYYEPVSLTSLDPMVGPVDGGTVVFMFGANFRKLDDNDVLFGSTSVSSHAVSSSLRIIETPTFSSAAVQTVYASTFDDAPSTAFNALDQLHLSSLSPVMSNTEGGQELLVTGEKFSAPSSLWCRVGTIGPLHARAFHSTVLQCISPAHSKENSVELQVSMNKRDWWYDLPLSISYGTAAKIQHVLPPAGHVSDHPATVEAFYEAPYPAPNITERSCFTGGTSLTSASSDTSGVYSILCTLKRDSFIQGMYPIIIYGPDAANTSFSGIFHYVTLPVIDAWGPEVIHSGGGTLVTVLTGDVTPDGLVCMFSPWYHNDFSSTTAVDAHFVSSSLIVCESPYMAPLKEVGLSTGLLGTTPEFGQAQLSSITRPIITGVEPTSLSLEGGTTISVVGTDLGLQVYDLYASFGSISPLSLRWANSQTVEVISPVTSTGNKTLFLSHSLSAMSDAYGVDVVFFSTFEPSPLIPDVVPASASAYVRLHARVGFLPSSVPTCTSTPQYTLCKEAVNIGVILTQMQSPNFAVLNIPGSSVTRNVPQLAYVESSLPESVQPSILASEGGTVAVISGSNFIEGVTAIRVGDVALPVPHQSSSFLSSTLIRFEAPEGVDETRDSVYASKAHVDAESWSKSEDYITYYDVPRLSAAIGASATVLEMGGALVEVGGFGFRANRDLYCKFGEVHIKATFVSSIGIQCLSPALASMEYSLRVSNNMLDYSKYMNMNGTADDADVSIVAVQDFVSGVSSVDGAYGPNTGGTLLSLTFTSTAPSVIGCKFDSRLGSGFVTSSSTAKCVTPSSDPGFVSVLVSSSLKANAVFSSVGAQFEFLTAPEIDMVYPEMGLLGGGTLVNIHGDNLVQSISVAAHGSPLMPGASVEGLSCRFGGIYTIAAVLVSSTIMRCETPAFASALVELPLVVDLSLNALEWTGSQTVFEPIPDSMISYLSPTAGSRAGGTTVTIGGGFFSPKTPVWCKFGTTGPIHAFFNGDGSVKCKSPAKYQGDIPIAISRGNANDFSFNATKIFKM